MKKVIYLLFLVVFPIIGYTQVGIGTTTPVKVAALQIDGLGGGQGLIIPKVQQLSDVDLASLSAADRAEAEDIIVYLVPEGKYYFWNGVEWQCVNPFATNSTTRVVSPSTPYTTISGNFTGEVAGNLNASGANTFSGNGTIPLGAIVMWSGTVIPTGWALCNGQTSNGMRTPDLRGRFIAGYNNLDTDYDNPGDLSQSGTSAGERRGNSTVRLTSAQSALPNHNHAFSGTTGNQSANHTHGVDSYDSRDNNNDGAGARRDVARPGGTRTSAIQSANHNHAFSGTSDNTEITLAAQAHENRPPYYVLAFIMRIR